MSQGKGNRCLIPEVPVQQRVKVRVLRHIRNEDSHLGAKPRASLRRRPWAPDLTLLPSAHTCPCPAPGKGERGSSPRVLSVGPRAGRQPPGRRSCKVPHLVLPGGAQGWAMARGSVPGPRDYPLPGSRTTAGQAEESRPGTAAGPAAPQLVGTAGRTPRGGSPEPTPGREQGEQWVRWALSLGELRVSW